MAQHSKITRANIHKTKLLFLDEPTTGFNPAYREMLWNHVLKLNTQNNTTVFLTTHYMEELEHFSDQVAIYSKGEINFIGTIVKYSQIAAMFHGFLMPIIFTGQFSLIEPLLVNDLFPKKLS